MSFTINCGEQIYFVQAHCKNLKWFRINDGENVVNVQVGTQEVPSPLGSRSTTYTSTVQPLEPYVVKSFGSPSKFAVAAPSHSVRRYDGMAEAVVSCADEDDEEGTGSKSASEHFAWLDRLKMQKQRTRQFIGKMKAATDDMWDRINSHSRSFKKKSKHQFLSRL